MDTKLIIFDMDGVLVDACEWHRIALNEALQEVCNYQISLEDHYKIFNGIPTKVKLKKLKELGIVKEEYFEKIENLKQKKTIDIINKMANERQEKIELLKYIKSKNLKTACYTNSIRMTAELMLKKTGVLSFLDLLITNQDVNKPKPHPEGYLLILKSLNISKNNTIIIEDSPNGLQAATLSGCRVLKVEGPEDVNIKLLKDIL
jgi:HAD superfamily hydrolase (TIGR01509 family)